MPPEPVSPAASASVHPFLHSTSPCSPHVGPIRRRGSTRGNQWAKSAQNAVCALPATSVPWSPNSKQSYTPCHSLDATP